MFEKKYPVKVEGYWKTVLTDEYGRIKDETDWTKNVITTVGLDFLAQFLYSASVTASTFTMKYIAIGTTDTAETAADTTLASELARHTGTTTYATAIYQIVATFAAGSASAGSIVEYGLFSSSASGTMLSRETKTAVAKGEGDTLTVTYRVTFS